MIHGETLYRCATNGILLLCLDQDSTDRAMREVHAGVCGPHMGGHMLARTRSTIRVACIDLTLAIFSLGHRCYWEDFVEVFQWS